MCIVTQDLDGTHGISSLSEPLQQCTRARIVRAAQVDIQFLDHMRRGTSINVADLASDPPPQTLQVHMTFLMSNV